MNEKAKLEKIPYQLGLPPMELAETKEQLPTNTYTKKLQRILQKVFAIVLLVLLTIGLYVIVISLVQTFDCGFCRSAEIVIVNQDSPNITIEQENIEIFVQFRNRSAQNVPKRQKREISGSNPYNALDNFDDKKIRKARDLIMKHDVLCKNNEREELCRYFVENIKALEHNAADDKSKKRNPKPKLSKSHNTERITPTEKNKRETRPLEHVEVLKPNFDIPFEARESYGHVPELLPAPSVSYQPPATHYAHHGSSLNLPDTCLLAKLLKQNFPHTIHGIADYARPQYESHPLPYARFATPAVAQPPSFHNPEANIHHRTIHPQDAMILTNFFTTVKPEALTNSSSRDAECPPGSIPCAGSGECVTEKQWCDGNVDCSDVSDEATCSCKSRVDKARLCDGYFDCPFGEDEMGCHGCSDSTFSCEDLDMNSQSTCFSKEQRCNNVADCPNQRDELDCTMLSPTLHKTALFAVSNTEGFLHRNFKGEWYAVCKNPYMWAHDACRRETGIIIRPPFIQVVPIDPMLRVNYLNTGHGGMIHLSNTCFNSSAVYVTCPDLLCGTRITPSTQRLREKDEVENHLFGRNKRFLLSGYPYPIIYYNDRVKRHVENATFNSEQILRNQDKEMSKFSNLRNKRTESRVVGGRPSQPTSWPWMVAMYRDGMFHCGGVILTQHWVLSAAHCVSKFWEHYFEIQVGMLRRFSFSPQEQNRKVTHIIVNQLYSQADMKNDLSLLKVKPVIQFSRWVRPICLPGPDTAGAEWLWGPPAGTMCTAVGWGATVEHGPDPDHMREVEVPIWEHCKHREDRAGKEICAGVSEGGKDACQGDSGGPLLCKNPLNSEQWYMAGIVSHGDGCARKDEPGVYTRVSLFVKWIRFHILSGDDSLPQVQPKQECPGFRCVTGIAKCLPAKRVCDKIIDCLGGEDEMNCNSMRTQNQFTNLFTMPVFRNSDNINNKMPETREASSEERISISKQNETTKFYRIDISSESQDDSGSTEKSTKNKVTVSESSEIDTFTRGDLEKAMSVSSQKLSLESRSFIKTEDDISEKEADIDEDWSGEATTVKTEILPNIVTDSLTINDQSTIEDMQSSKKIEEITTVLATTLSIESTTSVSKLNDDFVESESKDLLVDLPHNMLHHKEITQSLFTNSATTETVLAGNTQVVQKSEVQESTVTNLPDVKDNFEPNERELNNSTKLEPAKIIKRRRVPKEFECRRIPQNITYEGRCDRKPDCEDGTDELSCSCVDYLSRFDNQLLCDGIFDCADGQDEMDCFSCPDDHFLCKRSQQCLPMKYVCDGSSQCPLGEDELECFALTNGQSISIDIDGTPKVSLQGFLTKKNNNEWHVVCEENLSTEQQELAAARICRYLGFSSANRYFVKHINVREEIFKSTSGDSARNRRTIGDTIPVHFAYRKSEDSGNVLIKEPEVLKEQCVPNVTKTCQSLYVYCDHALFTDNFEMNNEIIYNREAETRIHMWPWVAKVFVDGDYKCSGVLIDPSWALVSHNCLWDSLLSHHHIAVVLGSHKTLSSSKGKYEQIRKVDAKKDLYHSKAVLLHLKKPAEYSKFVKPMIVPSNTLEEKSDICVAMGQDENNGTVGIFLRETSECDLQNRCFTRTEKEPICPAGMVSHQHWAGIITCHSERGWRPVASFVDSRGECGIGDHIVATELSGLRNEIKHHIDKITKESESVEMSASANCEGVRCGRGKCVGLLSVCDGVPDCEDQSDEMEEACLKKTNICTKDPYQRGCECTSGQLKCHNGKCIAKELFRDGHDDCGDETDEPVTMSCAFYLARVKPSRLCDGILHCHDRSDEDPMFCKCFAKKGYRCNKAPSDVDMCVSYDVVCDGTKDCPNGEDEQTCTALSAPEGSTYGTGQVIIRSHGVWHSKCYQTQNHTKSELEAICKELGFISGHAKQLIPPPHLASPTKYILDTFSEVMLNNNTSIKIRNTNEPLARTVVDNTAQCYPVYIECL